MLGMCIICIEFQVLLSQWFILQISDGTREGNGWSLPSRSLHALSSPSVPGGRKAHGTTVNYADLDILRID